jgi:K+-sensing histidine kinase KdpD
MRAKLVGVDGAVLYSNLPDECSSCATSCVVKSEIATCSIAPTKRRRGTEHDAYGSVYLCSHEDDDLKSASSFKRKLRWHLDQAPSLIDYREQVRSEEQRKLRRILHNLTTLNAQCIQEIYSFVPQDVLLDAMSKQVEHVRSRLAERTLDGAKLILRLLKNVKQIKTEFSVFDKLYDPSPPIKQRLHPIQRVILTIMHVFFGDFADKDVYVEVKDSAQRVLLDFDSFSVVLVHIADNCAKYVMPGSRLTIRFESRGEHFVVIFDMISLRITDADMERMFLEGESGEYPAKLGLSGDGIGMYLVKELLRLNSAEIEVRRNVTPQALRFVGGVPYEHNLFELIFLL